MWPKEERHGEYIKGVNILPYLQHSTLINYNKWKRFKHQTIRMLGETTLQWPKSVITWMLFFKFVQFSIFTKSILKYFFINYIQNKVVQSPNNPIFKRNYIFKLILNDEKLRLWKLVHGSIYSKKYSDNCKTWWSTLSYIEYELITPFQFQLNYFTLAISQKNWMMFFI